MLVRRVGGREGGRGGEEGWAGGRAALAAPAFCLVHKSLRLTVGGKARRQPLLRVVCFLTSTNSHDYAPPTLTALYRDVEAAEKQCNELEKVVALVENNRQRFRHIDNVSE